jgi:hypothetical protein
MDDIIQNVGWPGWETVQMISQSESESVYEIKRDVFGYTERAALKVVSIPKSTQEIEDMRAEGMEDARIASSLKSQMQAVVSDYSRLRDMNGSPSIISVDDFFVVHHEDGLGWDITVKQEILNPLLATLEEDPPEEKVVKLGRDICSGLVLCKKNWVVYKNLSPLSIFATKNGDYKLGDYVRMQTIEDGPFGKYQFLAPEAYNTQTFDAATDLYSFGLVLYWLLNERRLPFMPKSGKKYLHYAEQDARNRRFRGEDIPAPLHGSEELKKIVCKAVAFRREDRYQSAEEMLRDLQNLGKEPETDAAAVLPLAGAAAGAADPAAMLAPMEGSWELTDAGASGVMAAAPGAAYAAPLSYVDLPVAEEKPKKKKTGLIILLSLLGLAAAAALCWFFLIPKPEYGPWSAWSTERPLEEDGRKIEKGMEYRCKEYKLRSTTDKSQVVGDIDHEALELAAWGEWGEWQADSITANDNREVETKLQYRVHEKETTVSEEANLDGWILYDTSTEGGWGNYHDWSTTEYKQSDTRLVYSKVQYRLHTRVYKNGSYYTRYYYNFSGWSDSKDYGSEGSFFDYWTGSNGDYYYEYVDYDTRMMYTYQDWVDKTLYYYYRWGEWSDWDFAKPEEDPEGNTEIDSRTVYRCREKVEVPVFYYYDWSDWSPWSPEEIKADQNTQVESRTVYRYCDQKYQ